MSNLIHIKNAELLTKEQVSINEYGTDITGGDQGELVKFEVWLDATELVTYAIANASATMAEIYGFQFDFDNGQTKPITFAGNFGTNVGTNESSTSNLGVTINTELMKVAYAQGLPIVDNNTSNDTPPLEVLIDKLIGVFYVEPLDNTPGASVNIAVNNIFIVTNDGNLDIGTVPPDAYTFVIPAAEDTSPAIYSQTGCTFCPPSAKAYTSLFGEDGVNYVIDNFTKVLYAVATGPLDNADSYVCAYTCSWGYINHSPGVAITNSAAPAALYTSSAEAASGYGNYTFIKVS